jgi:hypothetical protein
MNHLDDEAADLKTAYAKLPVHTCNETWTKCVDRFDEIDNLKSTHRIETLVGRYSYAMAAVLLLTIIGAGLLNRRGPMLMDRDAIQMSLNPAAVGPSVGSSVDDGMAAYVRGLLHSDPNEFRGLRLVGLQRVPYHGRTMGKLVYTDGITKYVLLIAPGVDGCSGEPVPGSPGMTSSRFGDVNVISWCDRGTGFALAAPKPVNQLIDLVR